MTSLRGVLPVAIPLALVCASIAPRDAHAILRGAAAEDLTLEVPSPMGAPLDGSPSLVSAPDGTYIAWARIPGDLTVRTWSAILLSRATPSGVNHSPPDWPFTDALLYDTSVAFDGTNAIVVYSHGSSTSTGSQLGVYHPILGRVAPSLTFNGRSLDISAAPYVDHGTIPIAVAYTPAAGGTGYESGRFILNCDGSYGACGGTGSMYDTTFFDGRAALAGGEARFFMSRGNGGDAALQVDVGTNLATVPNAYRVVDDFFARDTGEFVTLTAGASNSLSLSLIDTMRTVHLLVPDPVMTAGGIIEVAIAPDHRGGPAWFGALEDGQIEIFAQDLATTMLQSVLLPVPTRFGRCQRFHIANFAAEPDLLAVVAQCVDNMTTYGHVLYWTVRRMPDAVADAGADVIEADVADDAIAEAGVDAEVDAGSPDATMNDAAADDVAVDTAPGVDIVPPQHGTGPSFRGSGCSCRVAAPTHSRGALGGVALVSLLALARRRRSKKAGQ